MKKIILILFGWLLGAAFVNAQKWDSVGAGIHLQNWQDGVSSLAVYNGELYAGGIFEGAGGIPVSDIARWNGTSWSSVGSGVNGPGSVEVMQVYNGELYVGGSFSSIGGVPANNIAKWNGTSWSAVGNGVTGGSELFVKALAVYNGNLIVGGCFTNPGNSVASWNGSSWSSLGLGITGVTYNYVFAMTSYDSILYASGMFDSAGGGPASSIAQWNGSNWSALGSGFQGPLPECISMAIFNHSLYAVGPFDSAGGVPANYVARWNGVSWDYLSPQFGFYNDMPYKILAVGNKAYFSCFNGAKGYIDSWDGVNWDSLGGRLLDTGALCMAVYNSQLYVAGVFHIAGSTPVNNIARWSVPIATGLQAIKSSNGIIMYPNPSNGEFTLQSSVASGQSSVEIYNILGEQVYFKPSIVNYPLSINISNEPNGVYLYRVLSETGNLLGEGKVVIDK